MEYDYLQELQAIARKHCYITVDIPLYDVELADKICDLARKKVRVETMRRFDSLLQELERKDGKLRKLGVDPDLV